MKIFNDRIAIIRVLFLIFVTLFLPFYPGDNAVIWAWQESQLNFKNTVPNPIALADQPYKLDTSLVPRISALGYYVADKNTGTPLLHLNGNEVFFPASTTKIITAMVALETFEPNQKLTVKRSVNDGQHLGLVVGDTFTLESLLYALLVHSANDSAYVIADNDPKGYVNFINKMNEMAKKLGMKKSYFKNPSGLDDSAQVTTPQDLASAARALLHNELLSKIVATRKITISDTNFTRFYDLANVNKLLGEVPGIGGLKTGFTESAGQNLVSFYRHEGKEYVIVVLKSEDRFADTVAIVNWINTNITYRSPYLSFPSPSPIPSVITTLTPTPTIEAKYNLWGEKR